MVWGWGGGGGELTCAGQRGDGPQGQGPVQTARQGAGGRLTGAVGQLPAQEVRQVRGRGRDERGGLRQRGGHRGGRLAAVEGAQGAAGEIPATEEERSSANRALPFPSAALLIGWSITVNSETSRPL